MVDKRYRYILKLLLHLSYRWRCMVWLIVKQINIKTAFTFVLQFEILSVVDKKYRYIFKLLLHLSYRWRCMVWLIVIQIHI